MTTFDQQFIDMMVPHHLSAVEMAKIAADRGEHPEIEALAAEIISAQETEIAQMRSRSDSPRRTRRRGLAAPSRDPEPSSGRSSGLVLAPRVERVVHRCLELDLPVILGAVQQSEAVGDRGEPRAFR